MAEKLIVYGANGYTGRLIVEEALKRGLKPVVAGRNADAIAAVAKEFGLESKVFGLETAAQALQGVRTVLHCAGPFVHTAEKMAQACLAVGADYLDITGEIPVFETLFRLSEQAKAKGSAVMPGVGFDIVPSDCLSRTLSDSLPGAQTLELAFYPHGGVSRGTLKTMLEFLHEGCAVRRNGKIEYLPQPVAKEVTFADGETVTTVSIPWGDVSTAYRTTGIPNITTYARIQGAGAMKSGLVMKLLSSQKVRKLLQAIVQRTMSGPGAEARQTGRVELWGRATKGEEVREAWLTTPEGYHLTALTAVEIANRSLARQIPAGFQTPAHVFGANFIESFAGVTLKRRTDPISRR